MLTFILKRLEPSALGMMRAVSAKMNVAIRLNKRLYGLSGVYAPLQCSDA